MENGIVSLEYTPSKSIFVFSTLVTKLDKNKLPKGKFKDKIRIHTKYKKTIEVADVLLEGKVI